MRVLWGLVAAGAIWFALPGLVAAGNCPPDHPVRDCQERSPSALPALAVGAGGAMAGAAAGGGLRKGPGRWDRMDRVRDGRPGDYFREKPKPPPPPMYGPEGPPPKQNNAYEPGGLDHKG